MIMVDDVNLVHSFFSTHPLMTLSTLSEAGVPQNAMVYVMVRDNLECHFVTRATTRKYHNLTKNPRATLSTYDENILMFGEVTGEATVVEDGAKVAELLPDFHKLVESRKASLWVPPVAQLEGDEYIFFHFKPDEVSFINFEQSSSQAPEPHRIHFRL